MQTMTLDETHQFLMAGTRTGKLATVREDGRPHLAPIWFVLDGETLIFNTWHTTVKAQNIRRDPRVSLCVDDDQPPFSFVVVEGTIEILNSTPEEKIEWATCIARRYMGDAPAEAFGKRNGVDGELAAAANSDEIHHGEKCVRLNLFLSLIFSSKDGLHRQREVREQHRYIHRVVFVI